MCTNGTFPFKRQTFPLASCHDVGNVVSLLTSGKTVSFFLEKGIRPLTRV
ncbi:hypothetical protein CLV75_0999 [Ruegeria conchae]|uniref:Uncharacterized protein n=1 Tax=Ruegeria conchae TaxID=981384 RepID=A0A497ZNK5_9RHOB|nr:hypothetical protein CLV75_0999 [Ruegeria conchae]